MMAMAALLYLALFALAAGMPRHGAALLGKRFTPAIAGRLAMAGRLLLGLSLVPVAMAPRWPFALIEWIGLATALAGAILLSLTYGAWIARAGVLAAIAAVVVGSGLIP